MIELAEVEKSCERSGKLFENDALVCDSICLYKDKLFVIYNSLY